MLLKSTITTPRLLLRTWRQDDLPAFAALNRDPRVMQHLPKTLSRADSDLTAAGIADHFAQHGFGKWAVEVIDGPEFIGFVGLSVATFEASFTPCVEIGWRLAFDHWGRGYATEAARAVLDFAFGALDLDKVVSFTVPANQKSRGVMERVGMTHSPSDDFQHPLLPEGHPLRPHILYRVSRTQWEIVQSHLS